MLDDMNFVPTPTTPKDMLKLHMLYLEKVVHLNSEEREVFIQYFKALAAPPVLLNLDTKEQIENPHNGTFSAVLR